MTILNCKIASHHIASHHISSHHITSHHITSQAESHSMGVQQRLDAAESSKLKLEQDNLALYTKMRYLQSVANGTAGTGKGQVLSLPLYAMNCNIWTFIVSVLLSGSIYVIMFIDCVKDCFSSLQSLESNLFHSIFNHSSSTPPYAILCTDLFFFRNVRTAHAHPQLGRV